MNKEKSHIIIQSTIVAITIALLLPTAWVSFLSEVRTTPVVSETIRDSMPAEEYEEWFEKNAKPASLYYRVKIISIFIQNHWGGFLQASAGIFITVFLLNYFVLIFLHAKP